MESKFQKISQFIDNLEKENVINEEDQSILLVGGGGGAVKTNNSCTNYGDCSDSINNNCTNHC